MVRKAGGKGHGDQNIAALYIADRLKQEMQRRSKSTSDLADITGIDRTEI